MFNQTILMNEVEGLRLKFEGRAEMSEAGARGVWDWIVGAEKDPGLGQQRLMEFYDQHRLNARAWSGSSAFAQADHTAHTLASTSRRK